MKFVPRREKGRGGFKLGNLSAFGGKNGATGGDWGDKPTPANDSFSQPKSKRESGAPDYQPKNPATDWNSNGDAWGRTGSFKKESSFGDVRGRNETPEEETKRGARLKVSDNVTVMGSRDFEHNGKPMHTVHRAPVDGDTRGRVAAVKRQNSDQKNESDLPSPDAVKKTKKDKYEW
jgi:hypothetical protein